MDLQDLFLIVLRATLVYFYLLLIVRLLGKREIGQSTAFDLIVALMLGEVVDEVIYGDVSLVKGGLAMAVIATWHFVNAWASYRSKTIDKLTGASPAVIAEHGAVKEDELAKERLNQDEVFAEMRLAGIDDLKEVRKATLETSGKISFLKEEWAKTVQKNDIAQAIKEKE